MEQPVEQLQRLQHAVEQLHPRLNHELSADDQHAPNAQRFGDDAVGSGAPQQRTLRDQRHAGPLRREWWIHELPSELPRSAEHELPRLRHKHESVHVDRADERSHQSHAA